MNEFQNSALFWQKVDTLYLSSDIVITRKKMVADPKFPDIQYPCNYGYLKTLSKDSEDLVPCFVGEGPREVTAIIICANILRKKLESLVLIGTNGEEEEKVLRFMNQTEFQKSIIIRRGYDIPSWAITE